MNKYSKGFSTVFLCIILSVCILASLCMFELVSGSSASTIAENLSFIAGRSVLSEYNKDLYDNYGIFALCTSSSTIDTKFRFYVESSLASSNGLIVLTLDDVAVDIESYRFTNEELKRQVEAICGNISVYAKQCLSCKTKIKTDSLRQYEREYLICGKDTDDQNLDAIKIRLMALRTSENIASIYADSAKIAQIRIDAATYYPDMPQELAVASIVATMAVSKANEEVAKILDGETVPIINAVGLSSFGTYEDYLTSFILLMDEDILYERLKKIIEDNLELSGNSFSFSNSFYGFNISADFSKKSSAVLLGISLRRKNVQKEFIYN